MNEPRHRLEKGERRAAPASPAVAEEASTDESAVQSGSPDAAGQNLSPQSEDERDRANSHD